eukprot:SAG25_NODE_516_length_7270_cov_1.909497_5_plen_152_part_00
MGGHAMWRLASHALGYQREKLQGTVVYRSEIVMNSLAPHWKRARIGAPQLCGCDLGRPLLLSVYDWDKDGTHDLIGVAPATFQQLQQAAREKRPLDLLSQDEVLSGQPPPPAQAQAGSAATEGAEDDDEGPLPQLSVRGRLHVMEAWISSV